MSKQENPAKPTSNAEKFKPAKVAAEQDHGRNPREMLDVPRGSEVDRRGAARNRVG